jgi:cell division protein FtsB
VTRLYTPDAPRSPGLRLVASDSGIPVTPRRGQTPAAQITPTGRGPDEREAEAAARTRFTSRAAVLALLVCAIALTLAYPIREYIAEHRQIAQLEAESAQLAGRLRALKAQQQALASPVYIEQQARDQLHMCFPTQTCYVVVSPPPARGKAARSHAPWYSVLWKSIGEADKAQGR